MAVPSLTGQLITNRQQPTQTTGTPLGAWNEFAETTKGLKGTISTIDFAQSMPKLETQVMLQNLGRIKAIRSQFFGQPQLKQSYSQRCAELLAALKAKVSADMAKHYTGLAQIAADSSEKERCEFNAMGWENPADQWVVSHVNQALGHTKLGNTGPCSFLLYA